MPHAFRNSQSARCKHVGDNALELSADHHTAKGHFNANLENLGLTMGASIPPVCRHAPTHHKKGSGLSGNRLVGCSMLVTGTFCDTLRLVPGKHVSKQTTMHARGGETDFDHGQVQVWPRTVLICL